MPSLTVWIWRMALGAGIAAFPVAQALAGEGLAQNWQLNFQEPASPIAVAMTSFNNLLLVIVTGIFALVLGLLLWVMIRYNEKANPVPSKTTHNTRLEIIWTAIPTLVLVLIAVPSFRLLYAQYDHPPADLTIKATGHQWSWSYSYPDSGNFSFYSMMLDDDSRKAGQPRLLAVDNEVVVPVGKVVHVLVTADDVIHAWAVPSLGVKADGVPGRVVRTWFRALEPGVYYGQCSELCGANHAYMPIAVRVVSERDFAAWLDGARKKFAANTPAFKIAGDLAP